MKINESILILWEMINIKTLMKEPSYIIKLVVNILS